MYDIILSKRWKTLEKGRKYEKQKRKEEKSKERAGKENIRRQRTKKTETEIVGFFKGVILKWVHFCMVN